MWSDNDTREDYLNFRCVADTAAELIVQANGSPLSIGVSGGWGVGKSSMLNFISDALKARNDGKSYLFINFNAWLYQGYDDARAALLEEIATRLVERAAAHPNALAKAKQLLGRVNWFRVAGLTAGSALALAAGLAPVGIIGSAWNAITGATDGELTSKDISKLEKSAGAAIKASKKVVKPKEDKTPPQQIHALREQFKDTLEELKTTLVVFIDDLDRCLPSTAISTLEAVRLFLFLPQTAFIIAGDDKMIRHAVGVHFKGLPLDNDLVTNYFDKLIQVPLRVPPLGTQEVRAYLMLLAVNKAGLSAARMGEVRAKVCERLSASWSGERVDLKFMAQLVPEIDSLVRSNLELADRLAPLMTTSRQINGNPRLIKRFLNTLWIRLALAKSQHISVDESTLAQVLLFERCADESAYRELVAAVTDGNEGRPTFLTKWERQARSGEDLTDVASQWNTPFVKAWLALEPPLSELDLRGVVYISRETLPLVTATDQLSTQATGVLEALFNLNSASSMFGAQITALQGREHALMFDRAMVRARHEQSWGKPNVLWALLALAEAAPDVASKLGRFFKEVDPKQLTPVIVPILKDKAWAKDALGAWVNNPETPANVKRAVQELVQKVK